MTEKQVQSQASDIPEKCAWIDEARRILYFSPVEGCALYCASPAPFWEHILSLMRQGYGIG